jgi:hypothetical protein
MGKVYIDPNLQKTKVTINPNGDIINPRTKQIIEANVEEKVDMADIQATMARAEQPKEDKIGSLIEAKINEKINALVEKKVEEILSKL